MQCVLNLLIRHAGVRIREKPVEEIVQRYPVVVDVDLLPEYLDVHVRGGRAGGAAGVGNTSQRLDLSDRCPVVVRQLGVGRYAVRVRLALVLLVGHDGTTTVRYHGDNSGLLL